MLVNGVETEQISATDRGLQYGDGLFETIAVVDGKLEFWGRHMARLQRGAEKLSIPLPPEELFLAEAEQLVGSDGSSRSVLKITITRGSGGRGYRPPESPAPTRILALSPWPEYPAEYYKSGVRLHLCETRLGSNPLLAGIKHLNRLEQVMARGEWSDPDIAEGLMVNGEDHIIEGTMSNIFFVRGGEVITPELTRCGVAGVMREMLIEQLQQDGISVTVRPIHLSELSEMEEAFCSNSLIHVWPVRQIGDKQFSVLDPIVTHLTRFIDVDKYF